MRPRNSAGRRVRNTATRRPIRPARRRRVPGRASTRRTCLLRLRCRRRGSSKTRRPEPASRAPASRRCRGRRRHISDRRSRVRGLRTGQAADRCRRASSRNAGWSTAHRPSSGRIRRPIGRGFRRRPCATTSCARRSALPRRGSRPKLAGRTRVRSGAGISARAPNPPYSGSKRCLSAARAWALVCALSRASRSPPTDGLEHRHCLGEARALPGDVLPTQPVRRGHARQQVEEAGLPGAALGSENRCRQSTACRPASGTS